MKSLCLTVQKLKQRLKLTTDRQIIQSGGIKTLRDIVAQYIFYKVIRNYA